MSVEELATRLRAMLDRMAQARNWPNEYREEAHDDAVKQLAQLPRTKELLTALDRAVGHSKPRKRESVYLLGALADIEGAEDRIAAWLKDGDSEARSWLIQTIGAERLTRFAPELNTALREDPDEYCREFAVYAAGQLRSEVNLPVLLELTRQPPANKYSRVPWNLLWALKEFARPEARAYFERIFRGPSEPTESPVVAAWGLCKLGPHPEAHVYLVQLLDDDRKDPESGYFDGVSIRAAQALCDIHGWPFKWGQEGVQTTKEQLGRDGK
jgi:hypothetical protein